MSTAQVAAPAKARAPRTRAPRRNFEKELIRIHQHCEANVRVLEFVKTNLAATIPTDALDGQIMAYKDVIARLNG